MFALLASIHPSRGGEFILFLARASSYSGEEILLSGFFIFFFLVFFYGIIYGKEMKKFTLLFFVAVMFAANALAAADTTISRVIPGKSTGLIENADSERTENTVVNRAARRVNIANNNDTKSVATRATTRTNEVSTRTQGKSVNVVSRSLNNQKSDSTRATLGEGVNTVGRNARVNAASINNTGAVRRAGLTLRTTTAEVGGRAKIIGTDKQTGSNIDEQVRSVHGRASLLSGLSKTKTDPVVTAESITKAKDILEKTADLNNTCQQQYNECMDQFCAVVDNNQKRCSCSANLSRYVKAQEAVEQANIELNDVAQRIRYVGLSADEIRAIMSETEAEEAMNKTKDTSENRSLLDEIADMIKDPTAKSSDSAISSILDLDFDFSEDSAEIFGLGISLTGSSNDIAKKRGKDLYNEATKRCRSVLANCREAGGTESQITGNYDLAIDKDCIAYEQGLDKLNKTLVSNVRSANLMLQKARLAVLQNKNQYDVRGCIGALEKCMLDDMVCGENYFKCIDPTKKYIDENGEVVLGQQITNISAFMLNYDNTKIDTSFIRGSSSDVNCVGGEGACIVNYLMSKIGTGATVKNGGLCRAVLDKCQDYTYITNNTTSTYNPYNEVVVNYIQRAMVNIKAAQSKIISDYASTCLGDMSECYNQQVTQINSLTSSANIENVYKVMTGACYNVALTCGYAVFSYDPTLDACPDTYSPSKEMCVVHHISEVFYQSLLCPENSKYALVGASETDTFENRKINGWVNAHCKCDTGYSVWNGACYTACENSQYRNAQGLCASCPVGESPVGGDSAKENNGCS